MVDQVLAGVHFHLHLLPRGVGDFLPGTALAMASAVLFGVGAVLQHHAATSSTADRGLQLRVLARQRSWVVGQLSTTKAPARA